jgi:hypothetical protein
MFGLIYAYSTHPSQIVQRDLRFFYAIFDAHTKALLRDSEAREDGITVACDSGLTECAERARYSVVGALSGVRYKRTRSARVKSVDSFGRATTSTSSK